MEQVFSPHPYAPPARAHVKSSPLYTDMRLTERAEVKRGRPSWSTEGHARDAGSKGKLAALDLQVSGTVAGGGGGPAPPPLQDGPRPSAGAPALEA